ncbi:phosphatase PAP2 family protein [Prauserella oleivorans]|uniref:Phosphatase PAP2 family protein n=1 Tax=Prauserella oleivorans TaxID=1478153 RepID=A0ABW5WD57_9PSEU
MVTKTPPHAATRSSRQQAIHLRKSAFACLLALGVCYVLFVWTTGGRVLDEWIGLSTSDVAVQPNRSGFAQAVLAWSGDPLVLAGLLVVVALVGAVSGRLGPGLLGIAIVGGSVVGARLLKLILIRPDLGIEASTTHNSFPSGHVAAAAGLVLAALYAMPTRARWWCAIPGAVAVSTVGAATVAVGWHRPSDVLGGVLTATALCLLTAACSHAWACRSLPGEHCDTQRYVSDPVDRGRPGRPRRSRTGAEQTGTRRARGRVR